MLKSNHLSSQGKGIAGGESSGSAGRVELMDVRGLAQLLRLDRQTIYNWLHQHKISGIKVGGVWRFDRQVVEDWLQSQTVEAVMWNNRQRPKQSSTLPPTGPSTP